MVKQMKKTLFILCKKPIRILIALITFVILIYTSLSVSKFFFYKEYFEILTKVSDNPGLNDDYIPQGITFFHDSYYTTGYMKNGKTSRIYRVNPQTKEIYFVKLLSNGRAFTGHTGGLQYDNGWFYLANGKDGLYKFSVELVENANNGDSIEIGHPIKVNNSTSFVFTDADFLYTGEFNHGSYVCKNAFSFNGINHNAIVEKFSKNDLSAPIAIYSIPNKVQGFCITDKGTIVLSTSYGLASSVLYVYKASDIIETGCIMHGAPVYFLGDPTDTILAPPMTEDLDIVNGKIITMFESASNKYIFGKPFGAHYIAGLDIE